MAPPATSLDELLAAHDPAPHTPLPLTGPAYSHVHANWAGSFWSRPELHLAPRSEADIQRIVTLAARLRRRIVVVGAAHSPGPLTLSCGWVVSLARFAAVLGVDEEARTVRAQAGVRLATLNGVVAERGLALPNLGSIDAQTLAGVLATGTHGSSLAHGLLAENVVSLRICLSNAQIVTCSRSENAELFRAALVSLGALGVVVEIEYRLAKARRLAWHQCVKPLDYVIDNWDTGFWEQTEFIRVWWLPYIHRAVVWKAWETDEPLRPSQSGMITGALNYHMYHVLLWISHYIPRLVPWVDWFMFGLQYGFKFDGEESAVEEQRNALLLDCLYSQFVNEWAIPISKGPEAIRRLNAWLFGDDATSGIPFSSKGIWVHSPIEIRVSDSTRKEAGPRPYLDFTCKTEPTMFLNAIMYRPFGLEPKCTKRYYQAFEWLMKDLGGRPHWAKNFTFVKGSDIQEMYGDDLKKWRKVRNEVDPDGVFVGDFIRRYLLDGGEQDPDKPVERLKCEEVEMYTRQTRTRGTRWFGKQAYEIDTDTKLRSTFSSEESFGHIAGAEADVSELYEALSEDG